MLQETQFFERNVAALEPTRFGFLQQRFNRFADLPDLAGTSGLEDTSRWRIRCGRNFPFETNSYVFLQVR
jgi:hypothetical protein